MEFQDFEISNLNSSNSTTIDYNAFRPSFGKLAQVTVWHFPDKDHQNLVLNEIPTNQKKWIFDSNLTGEAIKQKICSELTKNPQDYCLKILSNRLGVSITNENLLLKRVDWIAYLNIAFVPTHLELLRKSDLAHYPAPDLVVSKEMNIFHDIQNLVGTSLSASLGYSSEARELRASMAQNFMKHPIAHNAFRDSYPQYLLAPLAVPSQLTLELKVLFVAHLKAGATLQLPISATLHELRTRVAETFKNKGITLDWTQYVLKVVGLHEFLVDPDVALENFEHCRTCAFKSQAAHLKIVQLDPQLAAARDEVLQPFFVDLALAAIPHFETPENHFLTTDIDRPFKVKVNGCEGVPPTTKEVRDQEKTELVLINSVPISKAHLFFRLSIFHGDQRLHADLFTESVPYSSDPRWGSWLTATNLPIKILLRATRICLTLFARTVPSNESNKITGIVKGDVPVAWTNIRLIDQHGEMITGTHAIRLWEDGTEGNPLGTCAQNLNDKTPMIVFVNFDTFLNPVFWNGAEKIIANQPSQTSASDNNTNTNNNSPALSSSASTGISASIKEYLEQTLKKDALLDLTPRDKETLWQTRDLLPALPHALPKFVLSLVGTSSEHAHELSRLLLLWKHPTPLQALELLDARFAFTTVRQFAVKCLEALSDSQLSDVLPQLVQVLKFELYHDNLLARFLLRRALQNKHQIGYALYWSLRGDMHQAEVSERYGVILECFLRNCGSAFREEVSKQTRLLTDLERIALNCKKENEKTKLQLLHTSLAKVSVPDTSLPLDPRMRVTSLLVPQCKVMNSKKQPLYLIFQNSDLQPLAVIFKAGDDLRQDVLTLQMIRLMDRLWRESGYDLRLKPYKVVSTGFNIGLVEVVPDSKTTAGINGVPSNLIKENILHDWLKSKNPSDLEIKIAEQNFFLSCAGYCVATYVLGIGDRHNDNIMLTEKGHLFHIDFGHFLGHFKTKKIMFVEFQRETAPFCFTPQDKYILTQGEKNPQNYVAWQNKCIEIYNIIRQHADLFINLFVLMLSTGIPELNSIQDISYLRTQLQLQASPSQVREHLLGKIEESLSNKKTQFMHLVHIMKTKKSSSKSKEGWLKSFAKF